MRKTENNERTLNIVRIAALSILAFCFVIMAFNAITGTELSDAAVRFLGAVDLLALPAAVFSSVRIRMIRTERRAHNGEAV